MKEMTDKVAFNIIKEKSPRLIELIEAMFEMGISAQEIERRLRRQRYASTTNLTIHAAYYLQDNQ